MAKKKTQNLSRSFGFNSPDYSTGGNLYFLGGIKPPTEMQSGVGSVAGSIGGMIPTNTKGGAAASGAMQGASLGMNFGPWGAAAGAIIGGAAGFIGKENQMNKDAFASSANDMRQRNEMLGIKANGGSLRSYEVSDTKPFTSWYDSQPFYTEALQNKYKNLPVKDIIKNAINDKSFRNSKLNQYNDSLISKYGDNYLTENEVDSVAKRNNIPNIFDLDKQVKSSDYNGAGETNNTMGSKENKLNKYGYRMMLNRSFPKGSTPYKALGGFITASGVPQNMVTEYADGGFLTEFNAGKSHEENKFGGVLQGQSPDGQDNRVEEGETKYQDYIFSDRLKLDEQAINEHNLPKSMINKTFAEASKRIAKLHKERPNDPITRDTMKSKMDHLMQANDEIREYEQSSMMAMGGHLHAGGAPLLIGNKLVDVNKPQNNEMLASRIGNSFINPSNGLLPMQNQTQKLETGKLQSKINSTKDLDGKTDLGFFKDPKNLRYAPIAFDALAATGLFGKSPKPETYSPTLIKQQGSLTPSQVDEESMRAKIDAAYQNQIRGMAGASGGSGAALRSGLTGLGTDYMSAVGQGFLGADTANNAAKMQADQYNLGTAGSVASQNAQMQNQAGLYNNQMINQNNALNYDNKMSYLGKGAEGLGDIGYEQRMMEIFPKTTGYTDMGDWAATINAAKKNSNAKACGGRLKMLKRRK